MRFRSARRVLANKIAMTRKEDKEINGKRNTTQHNTTDRLGWKMIETKNRETGGRQTEREKV